MIAGALIYSRRHGYLDAAPGMVCVLRCAGQTLRVRLTGVSRMGRVRFRWAEPAPPRPSGWPRYADHGPGEVRAGRLQLIDD